MIILSHSDARALFLGMAQLIPVFLIALFVMDNAWISKSTEEAKGTVATSLDAATKVIKERESEIERAAERQLREIDDFAANYGTPEARSAAAAEMRAKSLGLADDFHKQGRDLLDNLSSRLSDVIQREEVRAKKRARVYVKATIATIIPGMLGEVISLWGSVGLADNRNTIAVAMAISVGIAGTLSVLAIDRLMVEPPSGLLSIIRWAWISVLCGATLTTFFWMLFSVQIEH